MNFRRFHVPMSLLSIGLISFALAFVGARLLTMGAGQKAQASTSGTEAQRNSDDARLAKSYRFERGGWIYVHLEGVPHDIGYQHGFLLASEIADGFAAATLELKHKNIRD